MNSANLLASSGDPYARRQQLPSMALSGNLSSGEPYYTLESLEGASALPPLKGSFGPPAPLPSDRDPLLGLDARTRALLSDRDGLDERARLLSLPQKMLLHRNVASAPSAERTAFADGLTTVDKRSRFDGTSPLDAYTRHSFGELQSIDPRARALGLDMRPQDALRPGIDDRARSFPPFGRFERGEPELRPERACAGDMDPVGRGLAAPFRAFPDYLPSGRDRDPLRSPSSRSYSSFSRRDTGDRRGSPYGRTERSFRSSKRESPPRRSLRAAAPRRQDKVATGVRSPFLKPERNRPPEKSEAWCALCKIDCSNAKALRLHVAGKKHKAMVERKPVKPEAPSDDEKPTPAVTSQAERKRANDANPETLQSSKRSKTLEPALENGAPAKGTDATEGMVYESKEKAKEKGKLPVKEMMELLSCDVCNIFTTGQSSLDDHLKGKRHASRLRSKLAEDKAAK